MSFAITLHPDLAAEINQAKMWYDAEQPGLGAVFDTELFDRFQFIADNPFVFAVFQKDIRLARIKQFPYVILYRVEDSIIRILAVVHSARRLNKWLKRR
ncbi:type II toxin-antitoxin system RelE/ParE family toxin [Anatilimnocola sp. NA78]|uniref:type II toxin-antitoxin system RelE/ParE family toxin n=1 Tax=Anatilimnocola sp. NA78 TaxID=3415683 RepID=UPI003CE52000